MSFSTAELFQSTAVGAITHNGKSSKPKSSIIRKGNSVKLEKKPRIIHNNNRIAHRHKDSSQFVHHVPHNSTTEQYRFYDDIVNGNANNNMLFQQMEQHQHQHQHQHINNHSRHSNHKHNNSLASNYNNVNNYHGRNGTITQYLNLDNSLDIIDGDIPIQSQKEIMKDFFEPRVNNHLQQQSSNFIENYKDDDDDDAAAADNDNIIDHTNDHNKDQKYDNDDDNNNNNNNNTEHNRNILSQQSFNGTVREIGSPFDENDVIDFNAVEQIEIEDYTDHDEETEIDPMKLIAAKNMLRKNGANNNNAIFFPDTQPITNPITKIKRKRRKHNNTAINSNISPLTPASVVIKGTLFNCFYFTQNRIIFHNIYMQMTVMMKLMYHQMTVIIMKMYHIEVHKIITIS